MPDVRSSLDTMSYNPAFSPGIRTNSLKPKPIYVGGHNLPSPRISGYWQTSQDRERLPYVKQRSLKYPQPQVSINSPRRSDQKHLEKSFVDMGISNNAVEKTSIGTMTFVSPINPGLTPFRMGRDGTIARKSASKRVRFDPKPDVSTIINTSLSSTSGNDIVQRQERIAMTNNRLSTSFKGPTKRKSRGYISPSPEPNSRSRYIRGILKNGSTPITRSKTTIGFDTKPENKSTKDSVQRSNSFVVNRKEITYKPPQKPMADTVIQGGTMKGFLSSDKANYDPEKDDIMEIYCSPEKANSILKWLDNVNDIQATEGRCTDNDSMEITELKAEANCEIVYERGSEPADDNNANNKPQNIEGQTNRENNESNAKLHNASIDSVKDMDSNNNAYKDVDDELPTSVENDEKDLNTKTVIKTENINTNDVSEKSS